MKGPSYSDIYDFENLYQAAKETVKGKRYMGEELRFMANLEENLIDIQNALVWHTYAPGKDFVFTVHDPKERLINAPGVRDRVVHSAVCRVLEPYIDRRLDFDSYACRKGKGTLAAANRAAVFAKRYEGFAYFDIRKFFDTIPIASLEGIYREHFIEDGEIMGLLHTIFMNDCGGVGLKKGYRTSQLSANVYLNELDRFVRHELRAKGYVRYMDDFLIFGDSRDFLEECMGRVRDFLACSLSLELNKKSYAGTCAAGFSFAGYRIFKDYKIVKKRALDRSRACMAAWKKGKVSGNSFYKSTASRVGHCEGTSSYKWYCDYLLKALKAVLAGEGPVF